jgi:hypothetical protein
MSHLLETAQVYDKHWQQNQSNEDQKERKNTQITLLIQKKPAYALFLYLFKFLLQSLLIFSSYSSSYSSP